MLEYNLALFAHIVVVVYLLGADLGRLYLANLGAGHAGDAGVRRMAAHGVLWLGSATNLALILILPAGISLGSALGVYQILNPAYLVATWMVAGVWALVSIFAERLNKRSLRIADVVLRAVLAPGFIYDGVVVFLGSSGTVEAHWLAWKLILYGLLILVSIPVRWNGFAVHAALAHSDGPAIGVALSRMRLPIFFAWFVIFLAAWFGVAKPV